MMIGVRLTRQAQQQYHCTLCGELMSRVAAGFNQHILTPVHVAAALAASVTERDNHELNRCEGRGCWCTT